MRKFLVLALITALIFAVPGTGFASLGVKLDGGTQQGVKTINVTGPSALTKTNGALNMPMVDPTLIAAGAANGGAVSMLSSTTAVPVGYSYVNMQITTSDPAFSAKTLANGKKGQILTIHAYSGSETTTVTPATSYGWSVATFNAVDDQLTLIYIDDTDGWAVLSATSVTLTPQSQPSAQGGEEILLPFFIPF